ncbi:hypothetical protein M0Q50_02310 [bacterium]|jgi:hypothetical protein|nr:hypothetical protein [bacterium]
MTQEEIKNMNDSELETLITETLTKSETEIVEFLTFITDECYIYDTTDEKETEDSKNAITILKDERVEPYIKILYDSTVGEDDVQDTIN